MPPITLHYSEALVRRAVRSFWWRNTGWGFLLACLGILFGFSYGLWSGDRSWWVGLFGAGLGFVVVMAGTLYFIHARGSLARFRRMRIPEATLELGEERLRMSSDVGTTELVWSTITEVWRFPEFWLVFFSRAQFVTLPTADLDPTAREFILSKTQANGAKLA